MKDNVLIVSTIRWHRINSNRNELVLLLFYECDSRSLHRHRRKFSLMLTHYNIIIHQYTRVLLKHSSVTLLRDPKIQKLSLLILTEKSYKRHLYRISFGTSINDYFFPTKTCSTTYYGSRARFIEHKKCGVFIISDGNFCVTT